MLTYIIRRLLYMIPTVIFISLIAFATIEAPPGDFLNSKLDQITEQYGSAAPAQVALLRKQYGLDLPVYQQYFHWVTNIALHGNFGQSFAENRPVSDILKERIPLTIMITLVTLVFTWIVAVPIGVLSAVKQYSVMDYIFTFTAFVGCSVPSFLLALVLMYIFYSAFGWSLGGLFSTSFQGQPWSMAKFVDLMQHMVLPIVVIGTAGTASLVRVLRSLVLDELGKQYVQTARAKGLSERVVIWKHVFKIAISPVVSTIGWLLPSLISGSMITSIVLNLPTTGTAMYNALLNQDIYVSGAVVLTVSTFTVFGTLVSDVLLAAIDPRIRYD